MRRSSVPSKDNEVNDWRGSGETFDALYPYYYYYSSSSRKVGGENSSCTCFVFPGKAFVR